MQNLRDKLLKAGLISEDQAKHAKDKEPARPQAPRREEAPRRGSPPPRERPERAERSERPARGERSAPLPKFAPLALPNNKEFQRLEAKKQVELDRKIREMVLAAQLTVENGEQTFYFVTRKNKLRRMQVTPEVAERLEKGELAVVERPDPGQIEHAIVPSEVASQILSLQERSVRFFNRGDKPVGFLSDEELSRRQKVEADADARAAAAAAQEPADIDLPSLPKPTVPEGADVEAEPEQDSDLETIARDAEKASAKLPGEEP